MLYLLLLFQNCSSFLFISEITSMTSLTEGRAVDSSGLQWLVAYSVWFIFLICRYILWAGLYTSLQHTHTQAWAGKYFNLKIAMHVRVPLNFHCNQLFCFSGFEAKTWHTLLFCTYCGFKPPSAVLSFHQENKNLVLSEDARVAALNLTQKPVLLFLLPIFPFQFRNPINQSGLRIRSHGCLHVQSEHC